jgi:hypothetical protein
MLVVMEFRRDFDVSHGPPSATPQLDGSIAWHCELPQLFQPFITVTRSTVSTAISINSPVQAFLFSKFTIHFLRGFWLHSEPSSSLHIRLHVKYDLENC